MAPVQSLRGAARRLPVRAQRAPCRRRFVARRAADVQAGLDMTDIALEDPVDAQYEEDWLDEEEEDDEEYEPFDRFAGLTTETKWGFTYITELNKQLADTSDLDAIDLEYYPPWEEIWENWMGCSPEEAEVLYQEFDRLLAKYHQPMVVGDVVSGTVIHVERQGALVEIGGKAPAWAPADELSVSRVLDVRAHSFTLPRRCADTPHGTCIVAVCCAQCGASLPWAAHQAARALRPRCSALAAQAPYLTRAAPHGRQGPAWWYGAALAQAAPAHAPPSMAPTPTGRPRTCRPPRWCARAWCASSSSTARTRRTSS